MRQITKIEPTIPQILRKKRVAAYARVSMETDRLNHSLSAQISYYSELIQKNPEWEYAGVYADSFISGTSTKNRTEFQRMIADCEAGKIDIILAKSISRFARNTVDLLETVRHLKATGVEVRFEKERINSLSEDGEIMLTLLASFSQEESRSISDNVKWGIRKRFEKGIPNSFCIYGYRWNREKFIVVPEEAKIVRLIYDNFLHGISAEQTEKQLAEMGVKSYTGQHFSNMSIRAILKNEKYTGNMLLQKDYIASHIDHRTKKNKGELPQYWVANSHEAIIPLETFQAVQEEIQRRRELGALANPHIPTSCFTSKLKCAICGKSYRRHQYKRVSDTSANWECRNKGDKGETGCDGKSIPESALKEACRDVLGLAEFNETIFLEKTENIIVHKNNLLIFRMKDGTELSYTWEYKSTARKDCWTKERRDKMSAYQKKNPSSKKGTSCLTGHIRCEKCGENFRRQIYKRSSGKKDARWFCSSHCGIGGIFEDTLHNICAAAMGLSKFDESAFREQIDHVGIVAKGRVIVYSRMVVHTAEHGQRKNGCHHFLRNASGVLARHRASIGGREDADKKRDHHPGNHDEIYEHSLGVHEKTAHGRICPCLHRPRGTAIFLRGASGLLHALHQEPGRLGICQNLHGRGNQRNEYQAQGRFQQHDKRCPGRKNRFDNHEYHFTVFDTIPPLGAIPESP